MYAWKHSQFQDIEVNKTDKIPTFMKKTENRVSQLYSILVMSAKKK